MKSLMQRLATLEQLVDAMNRASLLRKASMAAELTECSMTLTRESFAVMQQFEKRLAALEKRK